MEGTTSATFKGTAVKVYEYNIKCVQGRDMIDSTLTKK